MMAGAGKGRGWRDREFHGASRHMEGRDVEFGGGGSGGGVPGGLDPMLLDPAVDPVMDR